MRRLVHSAVVAVALGFAGVAAAQLPLDGELGRWLDRIAPELAETLARHPRFQGETLRLVVLTPGDPGGRSNVLAEAVGHRLRQRLLAVEGVRLAAEPSQRGCEPPRRIDYLLRVDLTPLGSREARVQVAVVDLAESLWVGGISHDWQGALTTAERKALGTSVSRAEPGSAGSPIPLADADAVAAALKADLLCTLPHGLDGTLHVTVPQPSELSRVALALQSALRYEPLAALTADASDAAWLLELAPRLPGGEAGELELVLTDASGGQRQSVGSVFVLGPVLASRPSPRPPAAEPSSPPVPAAPAPPVDVASALLSGLEMRPAPPEGACDGRQARINTCVDVTFELLQPAYLFVLQTRGNALAHAPCAARLERAEPGAHRLRLRVPPGGYAEDPGSGPDAGVYVLAVTDRGAARQLREVLGAAPGVCGRGGGLEVADWLAGLERVIGRYPNRVQWRALQVAHDTAGIVAL